MTAKSRATQIPPTTNELLAAGRSRVGEGRLNLRDLKLPGMDDAAAERHVEQITHTYGAHAQIASAAGGVSEPAPPGPARRSRYASFRVDLPEYLDHELTERSALERVTNLPDHGCAAPQRHYGEI